MIVSTKSVKAIAGQRQGFDRILSNHVLYCTVGDNNTGTAPSTTQRSFWPSNIRRSHITPNLMKRIIRILFIAMTHNSAFFADAVWRRARMSR
ncbi:MAG: hypothetical protein JWQ42_3949 [Edaphobacter sp.]|nr:hypothetical protein [Edaphobacter sp.]